MSKKEQVLKGFDSVVNAIQVLKGMYEKGDVDELAVGLDTVAVALQKLKTKLFSKEVVEPVVTQAPKVELPFDQTKLSNFAILKKIVQNTKHWPVATAINNIADLNNVSEMKSAAINILDMYVGEDLHKKLFLEYYPWSDGYLSNEARDRGAIAYLVGNLPPRDGVQIVNTPVSADVIVSFDSLDYVGGFKDKLTLLAKTMKPGSTFYLRCHNYFSRHATRLYRKYNIAYPHLLFTNKELKQLFPDHDQVATKHYGLEENIFGEALYDLVIKEAGFKVIDKNVSLEPLDSFFVLDAILQRIKAINPAVSGMTDDELKTLMELQFIDYCLTV